MARKVPRDSDGLSILEVRFCLACARGESYSQAWRIATGRLGASTEVAANGGERYNKRQPVRDRVRALLDAQKISDLLSQAAWGKRVMEDWELGRRLKNGALINGSARLLAMGLGIAEKITLTSEGLTDDQLVSSLAKDDPVLAAKLQALLGADTFDTKH